LYPASTDTYRSPEQYLKLERSLLPEAERRRPLDPGRAGGHVGYALRRTVQKPWGDPDSAATTVVQQDLVVIPAGDCFYLFVMEALPEQAEEGRKYFAAVRASFKLLRNPKPRYLPPAARPR